MMALEAQLSTSKTWRNVLRSLLAVNEGPWRWRAGLEAGLATALPLGLFTFFGYQSLGLIASLGSFTALFFAQLPRLERAKGQSLVGAGTIAASAVGVLFAGSAWLTVFGVMLVACLACLLVLGFRVGAPGPLHFILVAGVSGHLASPASLGGAGASGGSVILMVSAGALSSLLVVLAPRLRPAVRRREGPARSLAQIFGNLEFDVFSRWVALRVVSAVLVASVVSVPLGIPRGYWVVLTAVAILQASHRVPLTLTRAGQRLIGTLLGVLLFALLLRLDIAGAWLVLMVVGLEFMIELVIVVARKLMTLALGLALTLAVVACGSEDSTAAQYAQVTVTANTGSTPELGPQGVPTTPEGLSGVTSAQVSVTRDGMQLYFDENGNETEFGVQWVELVGAEPVATLNLVHGFYVFTIEALGSGYTIADGRLEHTVSDDSHIRVPLVSRLGEAALSDPVDVVPNQIYDLFLHVSPPGLPSFRVPTSDYNAAYWETGMDNILSSSDLGVRMLANCEETTVHGDIYRPDEYTNPLRVERFIPLSESCPTAGGTVGVDILPPFVAIDPPASTEILVGELFVLTGDANDAQTGIYQVTVFEGVYEHGSVIVTPSGQPDQYDTWEFSFTPDTARNYNLTVIAADGAGNETMRTITLTAVADGG